MRITRAATPTSRPPEPPAPRASDRRADASITPTPTLPWRTFRSWFTATWQQGEHVTLIGTTGSGKTTLAAQILGARNYIVIFGVKGRDSSMDKFLGMGFIRIPEWSWNEISNYLVLWPKIRGYGHVQKQREVFADAMDAIYRQGGWCVVFDEVSYLSDTLSMDRQLKFMLQQGRSSGISIVGMTQRPAFIPLAFYDQASHLFIWRDNDRRNRQRIGELAGNASAVVQREVADLRKREVLYLHKDSGYRVKTTVEV